MVLSVYVYTFLKIGSNVCKTGFQPDYVMEKARENQD